MAHILHIQTSTKLSGLILAGAADKLDLYGLLCEGQEENKEKHVAAQYPSADFTQTSLTLARRCRTIKYPKNSFDAQKRKVKKTSFFFMLKDDVLLLQEENKVVISLSQS